MKLFEINGMPRRIEKYKPKHTIHKYPSIKEVNNEVIVKLPEFIKHKDFLKRTARDIDAQIEIGNTEKHYFVSIIKNGRKFSVEYSRPIVLTFYDSVKNTHNTVSVSYNDSIEEFKEKIKSIEDHLQLFLNYINNPKTTFRDIFKR